MLRFIQLAVFLLTAPICLGDPAGNPLNILFINADDLGWADTEFTGSGYYETPHIDELAATGMVFSQAYAAAANCAPSRASVHSGQATSRHGVLTVGDPARGKAAHRRLIPAANRIHLDPAIPTFPKLLQAAGYQTVHIGKWHIGDDPTTAGFDVNIGGTTWGHPVHGYFSPYRIPGFEEGPEGEYLTARLAREAVKQINALDANRPFLLTMQFYSPHTPIQAAADKIRHFEQKSATPFHHHPTYAAMISHLDGAVGEILAALTARDLADRTIIIFTSDNGGIHDLSDQSPLRGEKGSYYEGGIRVPLAIRWPGQTSPGSRHPTPVTGLDFFPTFLELAGVAVPEGHIIDGHSLVPVLTGTGALPADRPLIWHFPIYLQAYGRGNPTTRDPLFRTRPGSVIRHGPWKLHEFFEDGGLELYHLDTDPGERRNLAILFPEETQRLHTTLRTWRETIDAPMPTGPNPAHNPEAEANAIRNLIR